MKLSESEFDRLAQLSGLRFEEGEKAEFMKDFDDIVAFADEIRNLTEQSLSVSDNPEELQENETILSYSGLREDVVNESLPVEDILSDRQGTEGYFLVKQKI